MIYDGVEYEERYGYWHAVRNISNHNSYLTLPEEIQGKQVIGIDAHVFADNETIQVVEIPATITEIDNYAFAGCINLHTVKERWSRVSPKNKYIHLNKGVFQGCKELIKVLLPAGIWLTDEAVFQRCHKLETIGTTGENKIYGNIPKNSFQACISLGHLTIVTPNCNIQNNAFNWCSNLKTITFLSDNVECSDEDTWDSLYRAKLRCLPQCNLVDLSYDGAEVEIIETHP